MHDLRQQNDRLRFENQQLRAEVARLSGELKMLVDKAIIVLRLSGKVAYRGIQERLRLLFGAHVPHYVIHNTLAQAADTAEAVLPKLLCAIRVKLAGIDEVYLREQGWRAYGLLVVDLPSRAIVTLRRATDRTSDTWQAVLETIPQAQASLQALVSDQAPAFPALVRQLSQKWGRAVKHQVCQGHAMRKVYEHAALAWQAYRQAKQRYDKAQAALTENPEEEAARAEYWAARQLRNFHWRMAQSAWFLARQLVDALRQPMRPAAEAALDQVLTQLAELPADYQPFANELSAFIQRHRDKLLLHYEVTGLALRSSSPAPATPAWRRPSPSAAGTSCSSTVTPWAPTRRPPTVHFWLRRKDRRSIGGFRRPPLDTPDSVGRAGVVFTPVPEHARIAGQPPDPTRRAPPHHVGVLSPLRSRCSV